MKRILVLASAVTMAAALGGCSTAGSNPFARTGAAPAASLADAGGSPAMGKNPFGRKVAQPQQAQEPLPGSDDDTDKGNNPFTRGSTAPAAEPAAALTGAGTGNNPFARTNAPAAAPGASAAPPGNNPFAHKPAVPVPKRAAALPYTGGDKVQRVPYKVGVSSVTVEQMARAQSCIGQGAGLMTEPGPVEVYRLQCADGRVFMARCELRQCKKM